MLKDKPYVILMIGLFSVSLGGMLARFGGDTPLVNFLSGMFFGISIPTNIYTIWKFGRRWGDHEQTETTR